MALLKLKKIIVPHNRDGANLYFIETARKSGLYRVKTDPKHKYVLDYAGLTMREDNLTIYAFDPSGGPYMNVGYKFGDKTLEAILEIDGELLFMIK